jgi:hypothetical protein
MHSRSIRKERPVAQMMKMAGAMGRSFPLPCQRDLELGKGATQAGPDGAYLPSTINSHQ